MLAMQRMTRHVLPDCVLAFLYCSAVRTTL
jgi:hypothetical protein